MRHSREGGFTLVEIMIVVAIIALLAAIAIPNVLRGRTSANEAAAVGNLRALVSSLEMYRSVTNSYPDAWQADMYTNANPDFGPPSFNLNLAAAQTVQGYNYVYTAVGGCAEPNCTQYTMTGTPQTALRTGTRAFFVDETGTIRHCVVVNQGDLAAVTDATIDQGPTNPC
ncbi:MAG: prepilin-type N-terminal cleavage/methylation domain-containing protein [Candidatus Omnitrophica bacterium]|nr:prepilin-type N-terminal cleavage/methylation domain-containing protein [Candidatus Omnitrophota bacterium]